MVHMKIVKRFQNLKCSCTNIPCHHLSAPSIAMLSCKTKWVKSFLNKEFNFAVFVYEICRTLFDKKLDFIKYAIKYGVYHNQQDPRNNKTALHYSLMLSDVSVSMYLLQYVDPNILDNNGLPPICYNVRYNMNYLHSRMNDDVKLRYFMKRKSEKLFKYLFLDEVPSHFNSWGKLSLNDLELMPAAKRDYLLNHIRDDKGNTCLHIAAKLHKDDMIKYILAEYKNLLYVKNQKGKLASQMCKYVDTITLFDDQWYKNIYWAYDIPGLNSSSPFTVLSFLFPELIEMCHDDDNVSIVEMNVLCNAIIFFPYLHPLHIEKIVLRVRDSMGNNFWHIAVKYITDYNILQVLFEIFPKEMINYKNIQGDTPLHLATSKSIVADMLIKYGAHKDCVNLKNEFYKQEMNLQCIAARYVPVQHFPSICPHLSEFMQLHQAKYCEYLKSCK